MKILVSSSGFNTTDKLIGDDNYRILTFYNSNNNNTVNKAIEIMNENYSNKDNINIEDIDDFKRKYN